MTAPFVTFKMTPTKDIGSTSALVFGSQQTCLIDGLLVVNPSEQTMRVSLSLLREDTSETTPSGNAISYDMVRDLPLEGFQRKDLLEGLALTLEAGDTLHASSNDASYLFNVFISYRELNELPPSTPGAFYV